MLTIFSRPKVNLRGKQVVSVNDFVTPYEWVFYLKHDMEWTNYRMVYCFHRKNSHLLLVGYSY